MGEPRLVSLVRVLSALFLISAFQVVPLALLQRKMEFRRQSLNDFRSVILRKRNDPGRRACRLGRMVARGGKLRHPVGKSIGLNRIAPFRHWPNLSLRGTGSCSRLAGTSQDLRSLAVRCHQADVFIAGKWLGKEIVGFYSIAMHLASLPAISVSSGIINPIAFPAFSRMQHDYAASDIRAARGHSYSCVSVVSAALGYIERRSGDCIGDPGPKWTHATFPLEVLSLVMPIRVVGLFIPNALQGIGRADLLLYNNFVGAVAIPIALLVGIQWGLEGLSLAWVVIAFLVVWENVDVRFRR